MTRCTRCTRCNQYPNPTETELMRELADRKAMVSSLAIVIIEKDEEILALRARITELENK